MTSKAKTRTYPDKVAIPGYGTLDRLSRELGDTFYVYDEDLFVQNFTALQSAFRDFYEPTTIAYSYKTNYMPSICAQAHRLGGFAEIVSSMEYEIVRRLGIGGDRVIFNGPCKDPDTIASVLRGGGIVNIDSLADLACVLTIARQHRSEKMTVAVRCNFRDPGLPFSRFGLDIGGEEFREAIAALRRQANIRLGGLHCHYPNRDVDSFRAKIRSLLRLCDSLWKGAAPDFLNIGGGFAGKMPRTLSAQFGYRIPTYRQYAACIAKTVAEHYGSSRQSRPRLFIEPGTGIVANCLSFVTRIMATKNVRKTRIAVCSGSVFNTSPTAKSIALPIRIVGRNTGARSRTRTDIVGYTCIEADYLARGVRGSLQQGDFAVIDNVGSYSIVMKPPFILPNAPVIQLRRGGRDYQILKRAERPSDVFQTFCDFERIGRSNQ